MSVSFIKDEPGGSDGAKQLGCAFLAFTIFAMYFSEAVESLITLMTDDKQQLALNVLSSGTSATVGAMIGAPVQDLILKNIDDAAPIHQIAGNFRSPRSGVVFRLVGDSDDSRG